MTPQTDASIIAEYRDTKTRLESLANTARQHMQLRFNQLLEESASIWAEFHESFDTYLDLPPQVAAITFSGGAKAAETPDQVAQGKKIGGLRRSLNAAIKRQDEARITEVSAQLKALGVDVDVSTPVVAEPAPEPVQHEDAAFV
jgi:hypothetical protein